MGTPGAATMDITTYRYGVIMTRKAEGVVTIFDVTDGTIGTSPVVAVLSNESHTLPSSYLGTVSSFTGSGTTIRVYEGATELVYDAVGTSDGTWEVGKVDSGITSGALTDSGVFCTVGDATAMSADTGTVTFTITGKSINGDSFSITKVQSLAKARAGSDGTSGIDATYVKVSGEQAFKYPAGGVAPTNTTITLTAALYGGLTTYDWEYWNDSAWVNLGGTQNQSTYSLSYDNAAWGTRLALRVRCVSGARSDEITIVKMYDGEIGQSASVQFSIDGVTLWHDSPAPEDMYMRSGTSTDGGETWSYAGAVKIQGNNSLASVPLPFAPGRIGGSGDFVYTLNAVAGGAFNAGELRVKGSKFLHPDGTLRTVVSDGDVQTSYGEGLAGIFYLMWTDTTPATRFGGTWSHTQLVALINDGGVWKAIDNSGTNYAITIVDTDCLIAVVEAETTTSGLTAVAPLTSGISGTSTFTYYVVTDAARDALTPSENELCFSEQSGKLWRYNGVSWDLISITPEKALAATVTVTSGGLTVSATASGEHASLVPGDLVFSIDGVGAYKSVRRIVAGEVASGQSISFVPAFKTIPKVIVSPKDMQIYDSSYSTDQFIRCIADSVTADGFTGLLNTIVNENASNYYGTLTSGSVYTTSATNVTSISLPINAMTVVRVSGSTYNFYRVSITVEYKSTSSGTWITHGSYNICGGTMANDPWDDITYGGPATVTIPGLSADSYHVKATVTNWNGAYAGTVTNTEWGEDGAGSTMYISFVTERANETYLSDGVLNYIAIEGG